MNKEFNVRARIAIRSAVGLFGLSGLGLALSGLILLSFSGCGGGGPARNAVHGKVTMNGKPVQNGMIAFVPAGNAKGYVAGGKIADGAYSISKAEGPAAGPHRVEIRATEKTGKKIPAGSPAPAGTMVEEERSITPAQFNNDSKLQEEVKAGDNEINFDLKYP